MTCSALPSSTQVTQAPSSTTAGNAGSAGDGNLSPSLISKIDRVRTQLSEVCALPRTKWLEAFSSDADPAAEVVWWERLTRYYRRYRDIKSLSAEQRHAAFRVIFKLGMGLDSWVLVSDLAQLPDGALEEILALIHGLP